MEIGKQNNLRVGMKSDYGMYLLDSEGERVLLPNKYVPENLNINEDIDVFIYNDSEDRIVATTLTPKIYVDSFACLNVKQTTSFGAFLDWGLEKDLLVPFKEQNDKMIEGRSYIVYMYLDDITQRLVASAKINGFFEYYEVDLDENQEVDLLIGESTEIGYTVVINDLYKGIVYKNEVFKDLQMGDRIKGYVKKIREDNKIDISLQKMGYVNVEPNALTILDYLKDHDGFMSITDKSSPDAIKEKFEMSKKTFKKAIGSLYKQKLITLESDGTHLV